MSVGASPMGRTDLRSRDPFSVALAAVDELPDPADVVVGDSGEKSPTC